MATRIIRRTYAPVSNDTYSLRDMMNRLVENAVVSPEQWFSDWGQGNGYTTGGPAIDVTENKDAYVLTAALPGWKPDDVDITLENGVLTLKGEVKEENEQGDPNTTWHRREIRHSTFSRSVSLPAEVETDKVKAEFENGMLMLTLPKAEVVKPKQIKISVK